MFGPAAPPGGRRRSRAAGPADPLTTPSAASGSWTLAEVWAGSPGAFLGTCVAGFPNLFLLLGPNTGVGSTSVVLMMEAQLEYLLRVLGFLRAAGMATVEPRPEAERAYLAEVDRRMRPTVWSAGGCRSWYVDPTGRISAIWPGLSVAYRRRLRRFDPDLHLPSGPRRPAPSPWRRSLWENPGEVALAGRIVLVTGAARGIGAATATAAAALAADLGHGHAWHECDVTDQAALERAVAAKVKALGGIEVVVANAGVANHGTVAANPVAALARTIEVDLVGVVRTVSATLPHVIRGRGYYLLVSSAAAFTVLPGMACYCAAKAGVEPFGNALRLELPHKGVAVGTAHPGWVETDLVRDLRDDLPVLRRTLRRLPGPLGVSTAAAACAEAFVDGIERRRRRVYVPRTLAGVQAIRTLFAGPAAELVLRRRARALVPELEREVARLGRSFGRHSTEVAAGPSGRGPALSDERE